jgi:hypothetical protein
MTTSTMRATPANPPAIPSPTRAAAGSPELLVEDADALAADDWEPDVVPAAINASVVWLFSGLEVVVAVFKLVDWGDVTVVSNVDGTVPVMGMDDSRPPVEFVVLDAVMDADDVDDVAVVEESLLCQLSWIMGAKRVSADKVAVGRLTKAAASVLVPEQVAVETVVEVAIEIHVCPFMFAQAKPLFVTINIRTRSVRWRVVESTHKGQHPAAVSPAVRLNCTGQADLPPAVAAQAV